MISEHESSTPVGVWSLDLEDPQQAGAVFGPLLRRVMRTNPFYLASAVLVLAGMWMLWQDTAGLSDLEHLQINVLSLQAYELALVVTAIILARRQLWHDATMLYVIEALFVGVPFLLLSVGTWLDARATIAVTAIAGGGAVLAAAKFAALRRFFPRLRLSRGLLGFGALVLLVNTAMPLFYKHLHAVLPAEDPATAGRLAAVVHWQWLALMPVLVWAANLLPRAVPARREGCWLPELTALLWLGVTAAHLGVVGYVYDIQGNGPGLVVPAVWALAWLLYWRAPGWGIEPRGRLHRVLLAAPLLAGFILAPEVSPVLWMLMGVNAIFYGVRAWRQGPWYADRRYELALTAMAILLTIAALPLEWTVSALPAASRGQLLGLVVAVAVIGVLLVLRHPLASLAGAALTAWLIAVVGDSDWAAMLGLHLGAALFLVHSLQWPHRFRGWHIAGGLRGLIVLGWWVQTLVWLHFDPVVWPLPIALATGIAVCGACVWRWLEGDDIPRAVIYAGAGMIVMQALYPVLDAIIESGVPVALLAGGWLCFLCGTLYAWRRQPATAEEAPAVA